MQGGSLGKSIQQQMYKHKKTRREIMTPQERLIRAVMQYFKKIKAYLEAIGAW